MKTDQKYFRWSFWNAVELVHQKTQSRNLVTRKPVRKRKVTRVRSPENFYWQCFGSRKVFPGTYKTQIYLNYTSTFMYDAPHKYTTFTLRLFLLIFRVPNVTDISYVDCVLFENNLHSHLIHLHLYWLEFLSQIICNNVV